MFLQMYINNNKRNCLSDEIDKVVSDEIDKVVCWNMISLSEIMLFIRTSFGQLCAPSVLPIKFTFQLIAGNENPYSNIDSHLLYRFTISLQCVFAVCSCSVLHCVAGNENHYSNIDSHLLYRCTSYLESSRAAHIYNKWEENLREKCENPSLPSSLPPSPAPFRIGLFICTIIM